MKLNTVEPSSIDARQSCKPGRVVFSRPGRVSGLDTISAIRNAAAQRTPTTCSVGMRLPRYFAMASRQENASTVASISAIPMSRWRRCSWGGSVMARERADSGVLNDRGKAASASIGGPAAGNVEHRTGRERALGRGAERHQGGDLVDLDEAIAGNFRQHV